MIVESVYAASQTSGIFGPGMEFGDFILLAISLFVLASGVFSVVFILWGGLLLILSGGKDEKIKPAINTIRYAIIGIVMTVMTLFLFPILGRLLGLDVEKYAEPSRIFEKIEELGDVIFGPSGSTPNLNQDINSIEEIPSDWSDL